MGEWLSASEIGRRHGLSAPTVLRRHAMGFHDHELVAAAYSLAPSPSGGSFKYLPIRPATEAEARARVEKAEKWLRLALARLARAKRLGEPYELAVRPLMDRVARARLRLYNAEIRWKEAKAA
jgi:hypothetical protein